MPKSLIASFLKTNHDRSHHTVQLVSADCPNYVGETAFKILAATHLYMTEEKLAGALHLMIIFGSSKNSIEFNDCGYSVGTVEEISNQDAKGVISLKHIQALHIVEVNCNAVNELFQLMKNPTFILNYDWHREIILRDNPIFAQLFDAFQLCIEQDINFDFEKLCCQLND